MDNQINAAVSYINHLKLTKNNIHDNLMNMKYKNEDLTELLTVKFMVKNKEYIKNIYILTSKQMKDNINNPNVEQ